MSVRNTHPLFDVYLPEWTQLRDTYAGEREVKAKGSTYLPVTCGQRMDGYPDNTSEGYKRYCAYKDRALFPEMHSEMVQAGVGRIMHKPAIIELPPEMEPMRDKATVQGESLEQLLRRIYEEQLTTGRVGLMSDIPNGSPVGTMPYIAMYMAERIRNWDDGEASNPVSQTLNMVVLDESEYVREDSFQWEYEEKYRVLILGDPDDNEAVGVYRTVLVHEDKDTEENLTFDDSRLITPTINGAASKEIPFTFINSTDILPQPEKAIALPLSNICLHIYRKEADYNESLFLQGQDTLVIQGSLFDEEEGKVRTGASALIQLQDGTNTKAYYVGVNSAGLPEMRQSLESDYTQAGQKAGKVLEGSPTERESGPSLRVRIGAATANLKSVAVAGAGGLEAHLKLLARWMGLDDSLVRIIPNTDFADDLMTGDEYLKFAQVVKEGAMSLEAFVALGRQHGIIKGTDEEELSRIPGPQGEVPTEEPEEE